MSSKTSNVPRRSKSGRNGMSFALFRAVSNFYTLAMDENADAAPHQVHVPSRDATGKRQRNPSDKIKEQRMSSTLLFCHIL